MRIGSLFSGYGGLDIAVAAHFGATVAWHVEYDAAPSKILHHHYPDVPNYGDVTTVDWASLEPVDILTGGYPCQPFSQAGQRKGTDDERHLWPYVRDAIRVLRPRYVVLENVAGHRTLGFDRVLGDMAEDGLDVRWTSIRASDIGAPHHRERLFILACPADTAGERSGEHVESLVAGVSATVGRGGADDPLVLPTPRTTDSHGPGRHGQGGMDLRTAITELGDDDYASTTEGRPAEVLHDLRGGVLPQEVQRSPGGQDAVPVAEDMQSGVREQSGLSAGGDASPACSERSSSNQMRAVRIDRGSAYSSRRQEPGEQHDRESPMPLCELSSETPLEGGSGLPGSADQGINWGRYTAAIRRWEAVLARPAPCPTEPNRNGKPRLNAALCEWMMGLPAGWVTDVPDVSRANQLKAIGNGVCPQQAFAALDILAAMEQAA